MACNSGSGISVPITAAVWKNRFASTLVSTKVHTLSSRKQGLPAVRLLFDGANARWAARDLDLANHLQRFAVEAQHVERLVKHGLRQQRLAVPAPDHPLPPASHLRLGREGERASLNAVDHDDAMIVVGLVGLRLVRAVLDRHRSEERRVGKECRSRWME